MEDGGGMAMEEPEPALGGRCNSSLICRGKSVIDFEVTRSQSSATACPYESCEVSGGDRQRD